MTNFKGTLPAVSKNFPFLVDEEFLPYVTGLITSAKKRIYISTFKGEITKKVTGLSVAVFFNYLALKFREGVEVKFLINNISGSKGSPFSNYSVINALKKASIPVRAFPTTRICHAKIIIVDEIEAVLGSHNLSVRSCTNNFEVSYINNDFHDILTLSNIYIHAWDRAKPL